MVTLHPLNLKLSPQKYPTQCETEHPKISLSIWNWTHKFWAFHSLNLKQYTQVHSLNMELNTTISLSQSETEHWNFEHFTLSVWNRTQNNFILSVSKKYTQPFHSLNVKLNNEILNISPSQSETAHTTISLSQCETVHTTISLPWSENQDSNLNIPISNWTHNNFTHSVWNSAHSHKFESLDLKLNTQLLSGYYSVTESDSTKKNQENLYTQRTGHTTILYKEQDIQQF